MTMVRRPFSIAAAALCLAAAAGAATPAAAQSAAAAGAAPQADASPFSPAVFVNDRVITKYDLDQQKRLMTLSGRAPTDAEAREEAVNRMLRRIAAEEAGVSVDMGQAEAAIQAFAASLGLDTPAKLADALRRAGVSRDTLRRMAETESLWSAYVRQRYMSRAQVTDLELQDEIENGDRLSSAAYALVEIIVPERNDAAAAAQLARQIVQRVNGGEDPTALARRYSAAPTAGAGGRIGPIPSEQIPPAIRPALDEAQPGQAIGPLSVPGAQAVLVMVERRENRIEPTPELRERVRQQMLEERLSGLAEGRLSELRARALVSDRR